MYNLIQYSDNYSKTSGRLWQYHKDEPNNNLADSESYKSKVTITGSTTADGNSKDVEIIVPLKYLSNFWRTLEMPLINCEVNLILTWSSTCIITLSTGAGRFTITHTQPYVPVVTSSTQDKSKLLQQLKSGFKRTINLNKLQSNPKTHSQNRYLNHLVDSGFQGVNRLFVLPFEHEDDRTSHLEHYLPKVTIKDHNVIINGKNIFEKVINNKFKTYENIIEIATGTGYGYTTGCLLDYPYFKENYKMIAIDLSKQKALDTDPRTIQQINFYCKFR